MISTSPEETGYPSDKRRRTPFDEILEGINRIMEEFSQNLPMFFGTNVPESKNDFPKPFVWGIKMNLGPNGRPVFEQFGNTAEGGFGDRKASPERSPLVDVLEEADVIRVIAELPGVSKADIDLGATETSVKIEAKSSDRLYAKEVLLPARIKPETGKARLKNGLLEITFIRKEMDSEYRIEVDDFAQ